MFIIRIIRYLLGYVNFRAFGGFSDRFLNLCTRDGIPLWNIKNVKGNISASTTIDGYISIRNSAKKSGMKLKVLEKKGLIFFLKEHKKRMGIFIGFLIFICITTVLSQFIWSVSLVGNIAIEQEILLNAFAKYGVKVGAPISVLDDNEIAENVMREMEDLSWASVNRKGTSVVIEVREKTKAPEEYEDDIPTNLIASEDGVILSIDSLYGIEEIKIGSAVTKGDLLISGIIPHADGKETFVHADGYVKALVKHKKTFYENDIYTYNLINEKTRNCIFFFGLKIPFAAKVGDSFFTRHNSFIEGEKILLPLGIITEYSAEFSQEPVSTGNDIKEKIMLLNNACYVKEILDYCIIKESHIIKNDNNIIFYGDCEQEIGKLQEIYVKKYGDNT